MMESETKGIMPSHISVLTFPASSAISRIEVNKRKHQAKVFYTSNPSKGYTYVIAEGYDPRRLILDMFDAESIGKYLNQLRKDRILTEVEVLRTVQVLSTAS